MLKENQATCSVALFVPKLTRVDRLRRKNKSRPAKNIFLTILALAVIGLVFLVIVFIYYAGQIPDPSAIASHRVNESTKIYDRTGTALLYDIHGEEKRTVIPWEQISDTIKKAKLDAEERDVYNHKGRDVKGILRAV